MNLRLKSAQRTDDIAHRFIGGITANKTLSPSHALTSAVRFTLHGLNTSSQTRSQH